MKRVLLALRKRDLTFMLFWAVGVHEGIGLALIAEPKVASLSVLLGFSPFAQPHPMLFGAALMIFGLMALFGLINERHFGRRNVLLLLAPQYCLIFAGLCVSVYILHQGEFEGRPFPFWVAFAGLWPGMCAGLLHTWAVLNRFIWGVD